MCNHITPSRSHAHGLISRARGCTSLVVRRSTRAAASSRIDYTTSQYKNFSSGISAEIATQYVYASTSRESFAQIARGQVRYMLPHLGSRSLPSERMSRCVITSHPAEVMLKLYFKHAPSWKRWKRLKITTLPLGHIRRTKVMQILKINSDLQGLKVFILALCTRPPIVINQDHMARTVLLGHIRRTKVMQILKINSELQGLI